MVIGGNGGTQPQCYPNYVSKLNFAYKLGGSMQATGELGLTTAWAFRKIPGAQGFAGALAAGSGVVGGLGIAVQGASGWELYKQTGDITPFRNSLIGAMQSAVDLKEPLSALANGASGDLLGDHQAFCPAQ
ncbi:MAG: hypothetical protein KGO02_01240 [Alphaproteobacteria bacterium]|nr:hypothetical protein [Alphaproteobacteria bacterium]